MKHKLKKLASILVATAIGLSMLLDFPSDTFSIDWNLTASAAVDPEDFSDVYIIHGSCSITLEELEANDYIVELPVYIVNNPGLWYFKFACFYDSVKINVDSIAAEYRVANAVSNDYGFFNINYSNGYANNIYDDVTLFKVKYKVNKSASGGEIYNINFTREGISDIRSLCRWEEGDELTDYTLTDYTEYVTFVDGTIEIVDPYRDVQSKYETLANYYPDYLYPEAIGMTYSIGSELCSDVIESYSQTDNAIIAYAEAFGKGTKIIAREILALAGLQSTEEEWLEEATLDYLESLQGVDEDVVAQVYESVKETFENTKLVYDAVDSVTRLNLIEYIADSSEHISYWTAEDIVDSAMKEMDNWDDFGDKFYKGFSVSAVVDIADIIVYACQLYEVEMEIIDRLMSQVSQDSALYEGLSIIKAQKELEASYVVLEYLSDEFVDKAADVLSELGKISVGALIDKPVGAYWSLVTLTYNFVYKNLYVGTKITDVYQAIIYYDFYASISNAVTSMRTEMIECELNGIEVSEELLADYEWFWNARVTAFDEYLSACKDIAKRSDEISMLSQIQSDAKDRLNFDSYINYCYNLLLNDIENGTVSCSHALAYVSSSIESTCTSTAYDMYCCPDCGEEFTLQTEAATGHNYTTKTVSATCSSQGYTLNTCSDCGYSYKSDYAPALGHSFVDTITSPTCIREGYTTHTCETCNYSYTDTYTESFGHSYGEWVIETEATCTQAGSEYADCSVCGRQMTMEIEMLEHECEEQYTAPTETESGYLMIHCQNCDYVEYEADVPYLQFAGTTLELQDNLAMNYMVSAEYFTVYEYAEPYVVFETNGIETVVSDYIVSGEYYVFTLNDILPNQMNDTITATLYATFYDREISSEPWEYSVSEYLYTLLEDCSAEENTALGTLVVDLLNYGAASQVYTGYNTENFVNSALTDEQIAFGTSTAPELTTVLNAEYETVENLTVTWKSVGLNLEESFTIRVKLAADSIDNLTVVATGFFGEKTIDSSDFVVTNGGYYVFVDGINATQMSEPIYLTVYDGETAVSNTLCYSVESYAYSKQNSTDENLVALVNAMMKYGNAAAAYAD